ncbi:MAG: excinuclease ABC subunit UvrC [Candidatus Omnitrophica bacterium]|nr:excinuclease ABC subunit UvrC [Candidatus Omnitrophota bacterium]
MTLEEQIDQLPHEPGVYIFKDAGGAIIYIGKALDLNKRVRSYFVTHGKLFAPKLEVLRGRIRNLEIIQTPTEVDALLLEAHLINKFTPKYNIRQKDDKTYPLLKITGDNFPMIQMTRKKSDRKARYYGPYTDAKLLREAVRMMNTIFPIRKCRTLPKKACLYYHIKQCLAPCIMPEVKTEYDQLVKEINAFLAGGKKSMVEYLTESMFAASMEERFEEAQMFKEQIRAIGNLRRKRFDFKRPVKGIALSGMLELKRVLRLKRVPERIVCFDVSNMRGAFAVASKASFHRELADKAEYKRYKIKTVKGIDDYAMIQEALRRMVRGIREGRELFIPDLIVIDGGLGHLHAAEKVLAQEGYTEADLIALAKRFEDVFTLHSAAPVRLEEQSAGLRLLQKVRDEAHRFALNYHKLLRKKALSKSYLDEIKGIGAKRKQILLNYFESLDEIRSAGVERLAELSGMSRSAAEEVIAALKSKQAH